ncbi:MAG TPA: hypothetical protein DIU15_13585 [Deltaproteobacteria bacterium]|nr:hypothetical protein [Deltaproteobacteria bacterium]HCP47072.1 hypothetical protein [Deltaproteobacteria bacterium]
MPKLPRTPIRALLAATSLLLATGCAGQAQLSATDNNEADSSGQEQQDSQALSPITLIAMLEANLQEKHRSATPLAAELGTSPDEAQQIHDQLDLASGSFQSADPEDDDQAEKPYNNQVPVSVDALPPQNEDDSDESSDEAEEGCTEEQLAGDLVVSIMDAPFQVKPDELISGDAFQVVIKKITKGDFGDLKLSLFLAKAGSESTSGALELTDTQLVAEPELEEQAEVLLPDVLLPSNLNPGEYSFLVRLDEGPGADECVRDNNIASADVEVL